MSKPHQPAGYKIVPQSSGLWRVVREKDGAWVARDSGRRAGPVVREWQSQNSAVQFVALLVAGQPIATMSLAWIAPSEELAEQFTVPPLANADADTGPLAGLWMTDFYRGSGGGMG